MADGPPEGYVTAAEACRRLKISDRTLRRRVAAGTIDGEYLPRPQGSVLYVRLPEEAAMQTAPTIDEAAPGGTGGGTPPEETAEVATAPTEPPGLTARLLDKLDERDATIAKQHADIRALVERAAAAEARAETLHSGMEQYIIDMLEQTERAIRAEALAESLAGDQAQAKLAVDELREEVKRLERRPWWRRLW